MNNGHSYKAPPVKGYTDQSQRNLELVNYNKVKEEELLQLLDRLENVEGVDKRWLAIGRSHLEQAFMCINRSIFRPRRPTLEEMAGRIPAAD